MYMYMYMSKCQVKFLHSVLSNSILILYYISICVSYLNCIYRNINGKFGVPNRRKDRQRDRCTWLNKLL